MTSLNPVYTVGDQIAEAVQLHMKLDKKEAWDRAVEMLKKVRVPAAERRVHDYPHNLSGGMRQRVMIAMALSCNPKLLIADEPTTALDVTIQAQILDLMADLQREFQMSILMITHDLGVVAQVCEEVVVMYAGQVVEQGPVRAIFSTPQMPYTEGLLRSIPRLGMSQIREAERRFAASSRTHCGCPAAAGSLRAVTFASSCAPNRPRCSTSAASFRAAGSWSPDAARRQSASRRAQGRSIEREGNGDARPHPHVGEGPDPPQGHGHHEVLPSPFRIPSAPDRNCESRRRGRPRGPGGRDAWPRRGVRLRQVHARPDHPPSDRTHGRKDRVRRGRHHPPFGPEHEKVPR